MHRQEIDVRIVRRSAYQNGTGWNYPVNLYPFNTFYFVRGGDGHVKVNHTTVSLQPGYVYLIPANTLYSCWCDSAIDKLYVEAHVTYVPGRDVFFSRTQVERRPVDRGLLEEMVRRNTDTPQDSLWFQGVLLQIISMFLEGEQAPSESSLFFKPMLERIHRELSPGLTVESLAQSCGMSPTQLSRAFHSAYGCGLKRYMTTMLHSCLREELITTDKTLRQLSAQFHFPDPYYLSAFFKKYEGISPTAYRLKNSRG